MGMRKLRSSKKRANSTVLRKQIEILRDENTTVDGTDSDILTHINHFLSQPLPRVEQLNLTTQEGALKALTNLESVQKTLEARIRTAQMLRHLAESSPDKNEQ